MKQENVKQLLKSMAAQAADKTPGCPDEHELAGFVDGTLSTPRCEDVRRHLQECDFCIQQVGILGRLRDEPPGQPVSEFELARARRLVTWREAATPANAVRWAAAAVIVLAVAVVLMQSPWSSPGNEGGVTSPQDSQQVRNWDTHKYAPQLTAPIRGSSVDPGELRVSWTETQGSLFYELRLVDEEGGLVWRSRIDATQAVIPSSVVLPGREYFLRVDAHLTDARTLSSRHVPFTVGE